MHQTDNSLGNWADTVTITTTPQPSNSGWSCPRCQRCFSPTTRECQYCQPAGFTQPYPYWPFQPYPYYSPYVYGYQGPFTYTNGDL